MFSIIPYVEIDGIRTIKDSEIKELFARTKQDGLVETVFYDGYIRTADDFLLLMKNKFIFFWVLKDGEQTVGYVWLDRAEGKAIRQHYCTFKEYWGKAVELGKFVLDKIMALQNDDGFIFSVLIGIVPEWNKKAIDFSVKCGGVNAGVIPNMIWNGYKEQTENAVLIYYTRRV